MLFRDAAYREPLAPAWRDLLAVLRRTEALDLMRAVRRERRAAEGQPPALSRQLLAPHGVAAHS